MTKADILTKFAFNLGQTMGLLQKEEVIEFLEERGVHTVDIEIVREKLLLLANTFYVSPQKKDRSCRYMRPEEGKEEEKECR